MRSLVAPILGVFAWVGGVWRRIRAWRRISFTSGGVVFSLGALAVGFAALNTGNNLLYLLVGAMLGFIAVSGWMSEQAVRGIQVRRSVPRAVAVGQEMRIGYRVTKGRAKLPGIAVEIWEEGLPGSAFIPFVTVGGEARARSSNTFVRRGIYELGTLTLSTGFPFGMFRKERDLDMPGRVIVWPRMDRPVPVPRPGGGRRSLAGVSARGTAGHRGEYRSLRTYRVGDDPRDIHWRSSARQSAPVIRQYERDSSETRWICLDLRGDPDHDAGEVAIEAAASLAAQAMRQNQVFALAAGDVVVPPGEGAGQLERVLDALAQADVRPDAPFPVPPVEPGTCVLVSVTGASGFGDAVVVGADARLDTPAAESRA